MSLKINNEEGLIVINTEVIASIAGLAAMECYGVVGMASVSATSGIVNLLKREHFTKGISVKIIENQVIIDLYVILQYGTKISVVAENIISGVKYNVEEQAGIEVRKVNLNIEGVKVQD